MSSEKKSNGSSAGIGLAGGVFLVFLILKLAEIGVVANWSWWWVTAPLWLPIGIGSCCPSYLVCVLCDNQNL